MINFSINDYSEEDQRRGRAVIRDADSNWVRVAEEMVMKAV